MRVFGVIAAGALGLMVLASVGGCAMSEAAHAQNRQVLQTVRWQGPPPHVRVIVGGQDGNPGKQDTCEQVIIDSGAVSDMNAPVRAELDLAWMDGNHLRIISQRRGIVANEMPKNAAIEDMCRQALIRLIAYIQQEGQAPAQPAAVAMPAASGGPPPLQPPPSSAPAGVQTLVWNGISAFQRADYAGALQIFLAAEQQLQADPGQIYNSALCLRMLGRNQDALVRFKVYVERAPTSPIRPSVDRMIAEISSQAPAPPQSPEEKTTKGW